MISEQQIEAGRRALCELHHAMSEKAFKDIAVGDLADLGPEFKEKYFASVEKRCRECTSCLEYATAALTAAAGAPENG